MLGMLHLQGRNKPQETMARAARSSLLGLARSARPKEERKSPGFRAFRSATHLLIPAAAALAVAGFFLFSAPAAQAATGVVRRIIIQAATSEELDEIVLQPGELVYRVDDPKDVRIGNGLPGGIRLWNFAALTNPPAVYDRELDMDGHAIVLNSTYSLQASGGTVSLLAAGTNTVFQIVGQEGTSAGGFLRNATFGSTPTSIVVVVQHVDGDEDPVVEATASLVAPAWTAIDYELERLTPTTVRLTLPAPELGVFTYYRVTTTTLEASANFAVPLYVQGAPVLTAETDPAFSAHAAYGITSESISNWNAAAASAGSGLLPLAAGPSNAITGVLWVSNSVVIGVNGTSTGLWSASVGGYGNDARGYMAIALGGEGADVRGIKSGVLAGSNNETTGTYSAVIGGLGNAAYGESSVVVGGRENMAFGLYSVSLGYKAKAVHDGAFVYSDNTYEGTTSTAPNQVTFRSAGGFRILGGMLEPFGGVRNPVNTTNVYLRPDGGTNTISFDADGNMIVAVDGTTALTVRTNGNIGIKHAGSGTYPLYVSGDIVSTSRMRASEFRDNAASTYYLDPNGESILSSAKFDGTITVTQGVTQIILPISTNGLVSGTLWNDGGTVKVMP